MVLGVGFGAGSPQGVAATGVRKIVEQSQVLAQHTLLAVVDQRVEEAAAGVQLTWIILHPQPGTHLQRQRQEHALRLQAALLVQGIPQVAVRQTLSALGPENVPVVAVRLDEDTLEYPD